MQIILMWKIYGEYIFKGNKKEIEIMKCKEVDTYIFSFY